ncbi:hypothetical protein BU14_0146s0002 [Porphyra umbilicalis]|uniref:Uncharacterized protein n=1 Tax=Porphyra umbilicalis TaxID=2786 RepID=A0A1X6P9D9_PORUM|nr:hypothetical protein BU14_0146s0002 [Porphyra umbilicalis]|eukprot:OSX77511.1 hypothetical protein BU14_0146s0002 [Porphyra umbilicalis]
MGSPNGDAADTAGAADASTRAAPSPPERGAGRGAGASSVPSPAPPRSGAGLGTGGAAPPGPPLSGGSGAPPPPAPSAARPRSCPSDVEEVDKDGNAAPPPKKRRVWPVGTEGIHVDLLCASAVTMAGAHLAEWGKGEETYERAADLFNQQPAKPFHVDGKAVNDRFKILKARFEKEEAAVAKESETVEELTEMDALMANSCSAMNDSRLRAAKAKGERTKKENALLQAGTDARRSALARRVRRREERDADVETDGDGEEKGEGGKTERRPPSTPLASHTPSHVPPPPPCAPLPLSTAVRGTAPR